MVEIDQKCIEWGEWYNHLMDPCRQERKCKKFSPIFESETILGPGGTEQTPTETLTLLPQSSFDTLSGFIVGGLLGLAWITYR
jgi:hypothetical protein